MPLFRKKETYNEQMLREAGLDRVVFNTPLPAPPPTPESTAEDPPPSGGEVAPIGRLTGEWDATVVALAQLQGHRVRFTALPDGDLILTDGGEGDLSPLADAIEEHISPPYTADAARKEGDRWIVGARRIEVAQFAFPDAETLELSQRDGVSELFIDGGPTDTSPPVELQRLGERAGADFAVTARRIDGDYWEVKPGPL